MDGTVGPLGKGSCVWYRQDKNSPWLLAEIRDVSSADSSISIQLVQSGKSVNRLQDGKEQLMPANPPVQQADADLTQLTYLNEPSIIDNLMQRYQQDVIYTNAGPVLIAVNPCRDLPLYTEQVQHAYKVGAFEALEANKLAPHIYLVAAAAFRNMVRENRSQSLVINGESGAGKTETTKKAMQFLAALAGSQKRDNETPVEQQVLETNPILEAFGNAKTLRNNNSSRFGKLIEIHFNNTNHICGARIRTYLLEKSRVFHQLKGERSYHIFYQLVKGAPKDSTLKQRLLQQYLKQHTTRKGGRQLDTASKDQGVRGAPVDTTPEEEEEQIELDAATTAINEWLKTDMTLNEWLKLPNQASEFDYLRKSGCWDIDGVDDAKEYAEVMQALQDIGVEPQDICMLLRTLSGILWLGNLKIQPVHANAVDSSKIVADGALSNAAELLGLPQKELAHAITHKQIKTPEGVITKHLTHQEAGDARDALAKALYSGVFDWIVAHCNARLDMGKKSSGNFIAILDIYGFEKFEVNSFEQLCINYANERLQQQFTRHLSTLEQEEYQAEGIDYTKVEWKDNQACVNVIESRAATRLGVLAVLDSQCNSKNAAATDATFMQELKNQLGGNDHFKIAVQPCKRDEFLITHYAGDVKYRQAGFLDKNKDTLNNDLVELVQTSQHNSLVKSIGAKAAAEIAAKAAAKREGKKQEDQTVSSRFTGQLGKLVKDLDNTGLHFVRCIKPNAELAPGRLSAEQVLHQLRCCGVLEVARVSRAGYPTRYSHGDFVERYKVLLLLGQQDDVSNGKQQAVSSTQQTIDAVEKLLSIFKVPNKPTEPDKLYQMGRTKVFFKPGVLGFVEDQWARMHSSALKVQAFWRMRKDRLSFERMRAAALLFQSAWRAREARAAYAQALRAHNAAVVMQRSYRQHAAQQQYQRMRSASRNIQAAWRRYKLQQRVAARVAVRVARERAQIDAQEAARREHEGFKSLKEQYDIKQSEVEAAMSCYAALRGELDSGGPRDAADALTLLAVVRETASTQAGVRISPQQLKQALLLSAVCQEQLGPSAGEQQLRDALTAAAMCRQQLGGVSLQELQNALIAADACRQHLGASDQQERQAQLGDTAEQRPEGPNQQLQAALATAAVCKAQLGSYDVEHLQQHLLAGQVAVQQLNGGISNLSVVLQLGQACCAAGLREPAQLQGKLHLASAAAGAASADDVEDALALLQVVLTAAGPGVTHQQVAAALELQDAAEDVGIQDAASLQAALTAAAAAGTAAAASNTALTAAAAAGTAGAASKQAAAGPKLQEGSSGMSASADQPHAVLASATAASGHTDPEELQLALSTFRILQPSLQALGNDPKLVRRACSMYEKAVTHGIAEKRDFLAAAALYGILRQEAITSAVQLRLALAMHSAVKKEGVRDADDLHSAVALASSARQAGVSDPSKLTRLLTSPQAAPQGSSSAASLTAGSATGLPFSSLCARRDDMRSSSLQGVEGMHDADSRRPGAQRESSDAVLRWLESELDSKAPVFEDDASFIREVVEGEVLAQDIAAQQELDRLRQKYEAWSEQFQKHMQEVQTSLLQRGRPDKPPNSGSQHTGQTPTSRRDTLTSQGIPDTSIPQPAVQSIVCISETDGVARPQSPVPAHHHSSAPAAAIPAGSDAAVIVKDPAAVHKPSTQVQVAVKDAALTVPDVPGSGGNPESSSEGRVRKRDKLRKLLFH